MKFNICAMVDKGLYRTKNQDSILINESVYTSGIVECTCEKSVVAAVADGVGSTLYGGFASELTLRAIADDSACIVTNTECMLKIILNELKEHMGICEQIYPKSKGMATTLSGIVINDEDLYTYNIGDSRVYRFRNGLLKQLTNDDSVISQKQIAGIVDMALPEKSYEESNIITKYISSNMNDDWLIVKKRDISIIPKDVFCIMSDGVYEAVLESDITSVLSGNDNIKMKLIKLKKIIEQTNNHDNYSLILIETCR